MRTPSEQALAYARSHPARFARELRELVAIPSVSSQPRHAADVRRCAAWLAAQLRAIGMDEAGLLPTPGHPAVYAAWRRAPGRPTILIYGHYDVQPAEPLAAWRTPPFEPVLSGGALYGRGASDDKGPLLCHIKAIESYQLTSGELPVNVVCLFEGEEEIGSPGLPGLLRRHADALRADVAVVSDTRFLAPGRPAIIYGLRGGLAVRLDVRGQADDVHAGSFGGALHNPAQALCEIIASLHDPDGRIAVPGVYRDVRRLSAPARARMRRDGPSDAQILRDARARRGWGEPGYSLYERTTARPALTVNGIGGGHQGPGAKAIIPAHAWATLSFRLVPDQEPLAVEGLLRAHLARIAPPTLRLALRRLSASRPVLLDTGHPAFAAAARAYRRGFGSGPVLLRSGGSIPIAGLLAEQYGIPTVLMGFALPDDGMHGPNERFRLSQLAGGVATAIAFLHELAAALSGQARAPSQRSARSGG